MSQENKSLNINISSTMVEKGFELAKDFLDKLIMPAVEETGILIKDQVSYFRFSNQIKILNKARDKCIKNNIEPKTLSFKLLCPLLDHASLEDNAELQDTWATMISNLVDAEQSVENHIFPYILSQISLEEWQQLYGNFQWIYLHRGALDENIEKIDKVIEKFDAKVKERMEEIRLRLKSGTITIDEANKLESPLKTEVQDLKKKKYQLQKAVNKEFQTTELKEYQIANLVRLGLLQENKKFRGELSDWKLDIPARTDYINIEEMSVDVSIESSSYTFTNLGKYFMEVCTEKEVKNSDDPTS